YRSNFVRDYPALPQDQARIVLVEAGPVLMPMFRPAIQSYTTRALEERGVDVRLGESVTSVGPTRVRLDSGAVLAAHTLVWGAGLHANPVVESLGLPLEHGHRVPVRPDLSV